MKSLFAVLALLFLASCSDVPAGHVGIKVFMYGGSKGVDHEVLPVGRYWIGWNEKLFLFPTYQQNYVWSDSKFEGDGSEREHPSAIDESIEFGAQGGVDIHANVGVSFHVNPEKVADVFQKYREGVTEIRNIPLRNAVRDAFQNRGSQYTVEELYVSKGALVSQVLKDVKTQFDQVGVVVDSLSLVGNFKLPDGIAHALNDKIEATQRAQQRQNEVAETIAAANKAREKAKGEADANRLKQASITEQLLRYEAIQKWNGVLPTVTGSGGTPFVSLGTVK